MKTVKTHRRSKLYLHMYIDVQEITKWGITPEPLGRASGKIFIHIYTS